MAGEQVERVLAVDLRDVTERAASARTLPAADGGIQRGQGVVHRVAMMADRPSSRCTRCRLRGTGVVACGAGGAGAAAGQSRPLGRTDAWREPRAVSTVRLAPASAISAVVEPNSV